MPPELPQRACIDCHFLALYHIDIDENLTEIRLNTLSILYENKLLPFHREQIKKREDSFGAGSEQWLGCHYRENWDLVEVYKDKSEYNVVLETERSNCLEFYGYLEGKSFEAGEASLKSTLERRKSLARLKVPEQSNKAESFVKSVAGTNESKKPKAKKVTHNKGKLTRGKKQHNVPPEKLIPFVKKDMKYLQSDKGGALKGGALAKRIQREVKARFSKEYGEKADYKTGTIRNLISHINTGDK